MAITLPSDTKFRDPFTQTGYNERITQNIDAFNGRSNGAIRMVTNRKAGDFDYDTMFPNLAGIVTRQDQTSTADVTALKLQMAEIVSVKLNRKIGPLDYTRSAFLKPGFSENVLRTTFGQKAADAVTEDMLNGGLAAAVGALNATSANKFTIPTNGTMTSNGLISGLGLFGDQSQRIKMFVMHSKVAFDLLGYQANPANNGDIVSAKAIIEGGNATMGKPVLVTDSPSLFVNNSGTIDYFTLALTDNAVILEETEEEFMAMDLKTGREQIVIEMQGEYAYNMGVKGFTWDVANGGKNPTSAALALGSNWDPAFTSVKDKAGVIIQSR